MAELVVTTSLDRSGFDKGVADLNTAITQLSNKKIQIKVDGSFEKVSASVAKIIVAQEKTKQSIEATKQAYISASASMAAGIAQVATAQQNVAAATATASGKVGVAVANAAARIGVAAQQAQAQATVAAQNTAAKIGVAAQQAQAQAAVAAQNTAAKIGTAAVNAAGKVGVAAQQAQAQATVAAQNTAAKVGVAAQQAQGKVATAVVNAAGKVVVASQQAQGKVGAAAMNAAGKVGAAAQNAQGKVGAAALNAAGKVGAAAQNAAGRVAAANARAAASTNQLANSVNRVSEAFTGWVTRNIWNALRNNLRDALNTMREMDTQLTTIRRVSGMSEEEVGQYQEQAYDISSKYGVKPADYLSNVVAFTRAGYGNLAGELAEVTTRLQVVGQVSQETATQMLLAVDAAYKFDDKAKGLGAVLDGVIAIGDNYATSVEKIAEGIGIIAPIAEQAHVGIDELSAAIGTITADTQRSGTEAARALRYVFLNILQNTSTEVEEGVTLTKEEIEGFQDVLEYFIPDVLALAEAEGKVINPMEALGAIAKGVKEDVIDEAQLFEMLTKVAGKLRASQVLALVNDWDKYSDMVKLFGDSLGETDSKVDVALSSWESKANMLSASFTQLFGNVLNSSMVKGGIDLLKNFVDFLNIGDGVPAKMLAIGAAFSTLSSVINSFAAGGRLSQTLSMLTSFFANPYFLAGAGIAAAFIGIRAIVDAIVVTQDELDEQAKSTADSYSEQKSKLEQVTTELESHKKIVAELEGKSGSLTEAEQARLAKEKEITAELERQAKIEEYKTEKAYREAATAAAAAGLGDTLDIAGITAGTYDLNAPMATLYGSGDITGALLAYSVARANAEAAKTAYESATDPAEMERLQTEYSTAQESLTEIRDTVVEYIDKNQSYYKLALEYAESSNLFSKSILTSDEQRIVDFVKYYKSFQDYMATNFPEFAGGAVGGSTSTAGAASGTAAQQATQTAWEKSQAEQLRRTQALVRANKEYNDTLKTGQKFARLSKEACDDLSDAGFDLKDAVIQDGDAFIITREALDGFIKSSKEWYENYGLEMPDNFKEIADGADALADSLESVLERAGGMADEVAGASKALADLKAQLKEGGEQGDTLKAYRDEYKAVMELWEKGFYGNRELQGFFNLMFGEEQMAAWGWDYKKAGEVAGKDFFKAMFSPDGKEDIGQEAINFLMNRVADKNGDIFGEDGSVAANIKKVNGEIAITVNSFEGLADVLGINSDVLVTLFDSLGLVQNGVNNTGKDVKNLVEGLGDLSTNAGQASKRLAEIEGDKRFHKGNVGRDASGRPKVKLTAEQAKEWGGQAGETATVLSQALSYDNLGYTVVFTPILPDGTVMTQDGVNAYLAETLGDGSKTIEEILAADADGLSIIQGIIEGTDKEAVALAESYGQLKHEMHDVQTSSEGTLANTIDMDKFINRLAMEGKNAREIFGLINSVKKTGTYDFYGDSATEPELISRIQQAVANANNKDLQLTPDASGWVAYEGSATAAIQGVQERWDSAAATIESTSPNATIGTEGLESADGVISEAVEDVERLGSTEGTGKAELETDGVPEGAEAVETAKEAVEDFNGTEGKSEASLDTDGLQGKAEEVEDAGKAVEDYNGAEGEAKAELDTSELDPGKAVLQGVIDDLYSFGVIDETAKANLEADLDDPEARIKISESLLTSFAAEPYTAVANADVSPLVGVLPTVKEAADTLSGYGVNYKAVVEMQDNIPPAASENIEGLLVSCVALDKTYTLKLALEDEGIANGDKLNQIKETQEYLEKLRGYAEDKSIEYIDVDVDATSLDGAINSINSFLEQTGQLKPKYETLVTAEVNGNEYVDWLKDDINKIQGTFTTEIKQQGAATVERMAKRATRAVEGIPQKTDVTISPKDLASGVISGVEGALTKLDGKEAVVTVRSVVKGGPGGSLYNGKAPGATINGNGTYTTPSGMTYPDSFGIFGKAEGTRDFPGGRSLVNELGPELIAYGGKAFVAGGGYPTIVNLPKGAMIFDAEETRSIVANSGGLPSGVIGSHAGGAGYYIGSRTGYGGNSIIGAAAAAIAAAATIPDWSGTIEGITGKGKGKGKGGGGGAPVDNTDYWAIVEAHYKEITAVADNAATNLEYQIKLLKDAWDDEKKPLDEQIKALQDLNGIIDRQITLLTRERDKLTKPIQDEVDALKEAKDIQDDQLELEERQKAVEEARAELQNAQNERTIRFYNKETGHWEWMADQKRVQDAQKALEDAQKSLADFEYDQRIKALEAEIKAIEDEYQDKFDKLNEDKQANEDEIYDLNQQLKDLERKYNELIGPLEEEKEDRARAKEAAENAWTNAQFERREAPKGNLDLAISKTGVPGSIAGGGIKELQADLKTIANAYKGSQQNNTLASLGIQFGATPSYAGTSSVTTVGNNVTDSHDIVINGITLPASAAYQSLMDLANDLSIYVNYK